MGRLSQSIVTLVVLCAPGRVLAGTLVEPTLTITAEERYDDDALFREAGDDRPIEAELMTKLSPRGGLKVRQRTLEMEGWYAPDLQLRHFSNTVRVDHRAGVDLSTRLSRRQTLKVEGRLWRVADPTSLPRMGMARTTAPVLYGTGEVGLQSLLSRRWELHTSYRFEGTRIFEADAPVGQVHQPSATLWYRLTPRASAAVDYRFQYFVYGPEQALAHTPGVVLRYRVTREVTMQLRGGPVLYEEITDPLRGVAPRVVFEVSRYREGWEVGAQAGQDVLGASGFSDAVWAQYAGVYGAWRISEPVRLYAGAYFFRNGEAPGEWDAWFGAEGGATQGYAFGGGAEWQFNPWLTFQFQLDRVAQVGVLGPAGDLSRNIAAVRLVVTPW